MRKLVVSIMAAAWLSFPLVLLAGISEEVQEILELSGIEEQVEQIPKIMLLTFERKMAINSHMDEEGKQSVKAIALEAFQTDLLKKTLSSKIRKQLNKKEKQKSLAVLKSPLVQEMRAIEVEKSTVESLKSMTSYAQNLGNNPPSQSRLKTIERLIAVTHAVENSIEIQETIKW